MNKADVKSILSKRPNVKLSFDVNQKALARWNPALAVSDQYENTITILEFIGEDMWGDGVSPARIAAALRDIGSNNPVTVLINSPGGDMFDGIAIYSLLKEHRGRVTVKIIGMAASAASIIAMAGDEIQIARAGFFMIHNAWFCACGNRHEFREFAEYLEPFDRAMSDVYQDRTGLSENEIDGMMDRESWIGGTEAIEKGFADGYLESESVYEDDVGSDRAAAHKLDVVLAKSGWSRSERRKLVAELKSGMPGAAADNGTPGATLEIEPLPRLSFNFDLN